MIIKILDKNLRLIDTKKGYFSNGVFKYNEGGIFGMFGEEKTYKVRYEDTIDEGKQKLAYVQFDGKNSNQLKLTDIYKAVEIKSADGKVKETISLQDYINQYKLSQYAKKAMLEKPFDLKDIIQFLIIAVLVIVAVTFYFGMQNLIHQLQATIAPLNATTAQNAAQFKLLQNDTVHIETLYNASLAYFQGRAAPS